MRRSQIVLKNLMQKMATQTKVCDGSNRFLSCPPKSSQGVFVQDLNPITGKSEWKMQPEDYDYQQEVARAGFADMLHDSERNRLYYAGLKSAISLKRSLGEPVHVLDIGTGTGLLSMMAATIGADSITAIEEFRPMANCAQRVMEKNGFKDKIKLVRKRSTYVTVGPGLDMDQRANILVTEVFDTELIGEGAIGVFNHAHEELLTPDCLVVPTFGTMYAQVVSSPLASKWNRLQPIRLPDGSVVSPPAGSDSSRSLALHDIQMSQFKGEWFTPITEPKPVFNFDFGSSTSRIPFDEQTVVSTVAMSSGPCDAVFMWWDLKMDPQRNITLTCAPKWAHPDGEDLAWRDHWMQAVYFPLSATTVNQGESMAIVSNHDEYSLWFDVSKTDENQIPLLPMPHPSPGVHLSVSRMRLGQINDQKRNTIIADAIIRTFEQEKEAKTWLCLSELSLLPVMVAKLGATKVYAVEKNKQMKSVLESYIQTNDLGHVIEFVEGKELENVTRSDFADKIDVIFGEPNFSLLSLPWDNLRFWFVLDHLRQSGLSCSNLRPLSASIWAVPVQYKDLWKIRAPLKEVEGFKVDQFDEIIMDACDDCDAIVEPHPLWEYPCRARGTPKEIIKFDFTQRIQHVEESVEMQVEGSVNGMALWMTWHYDDVNVTSSGPVEDVVLGEDISWDIHSKQGVHFFVGEQDKQMKRTTVKTRTVFDPEEAEVQFSFQLQ